jgi:hypothetical protein
MNAGSSSPQTSMAKMLINKTGFEDSARNAAMKRQPSGKKISELDAASGWMNSSLDLVLTAEASFPQSVWTSITLETTNQKSSLSWSTQMPAVNESSQRLPSVTSFVPTVIESEPSLCENNAAHLGSMTVRIGELREAGATQRKFGLAA